MVIQAKMNNRYDFESIGKFFSKMFPKFGKTGPIKLKPPFNILLTGTGSWDLYDTLNSSVHYKKAPNAKATLKTEPESR